VKWTPPSLPTDGKMPSCAFHHPQNTNKQIPDENSGTNSPDGDHRLLSNTYISAFDNSRTLNWSNSNNSRSSDTEHVNDLHKSDKVELKKTEASTSKLDMNEESTTGSHTLRSGFRKTTDLSPAENRTKLGYMGLNAIKDVKKSHSSEEKHPAALRREKRSAVLLPGTPIHVETAVFIDKDLYQHMALNFPADTERELVRVVLAMINAVSQYPILRTGLELCTSPYVYVGIHGISVSYISL
jgi:hypothetical protein